MSYRCFQKDAEQDAEQLGQHLCQVYNSETRPQEDLNLNTNQKGVAYIIKCPTTEVALGPCGDCYGTRLECPPGSNGISSKASSDLPPLLTHPEQPIFGPGTHPTISNPIEAPHYESDFLQHPPHSSIFQHGGDSKDENGILRLRHTSGDQTCSNRPELNPNSQSLVFKSQERKLQRSLSRPGSNAATEQEQNQTHGLRAHLCEIPWLEVCSRPTGGGTRYSEKALVPNDTSRTRWKPNAVQLLILEEHFNSGYTRATPELHAAVQGAGIATESQVTVWLKNRLSRCKKPPQKSSKRDGIAQTEEDCPDEAPWECFQEVSKAILSELSSTVSTVAQNEVTLLSKAIQTASQICCFGGGKEGLVMRGLASRLHHLGFASYYIGDTNLPQFGSKDLLLTSAGQSCNSSVHAIATQAAQLGAKVICFTPDRSDRLPFSAHIVRVPSSCYPWISGTTGEAPGDEDAGCFPLISDDTSVLKDTSSYEMSLWLALECVCIMLQRLSSVSDADMRSKHTNLE